MFLTLLLSATTALLASATPISLPLPLDAKTNLHPRAGGPAAKPVPASCMLTSLTPEGNIQQVPGTSSGALASVSEAAFAPSTDFRAAHTSYSYFLEDYSDAPSWNESAKIQMCLEQCYGFGGPCRGIAWGHNVWGNPFGHEVSEIGCIFLNTPLLNADLAPTTNGSWTKAVVVNIDCEDTYP